MKPIAIDSFVFVKDNPIDGSLISFVSQF